MILTSGNSRRKQPIQLFSNELFLKPPYFYPHGVYRIRIFRLSGNDLTCSSCSLSWYQWCITCNWDGEELSCLWICWSNMHINFTPLSIRFLVSRWYKLKFQNSVWGYFYPKMSADGKGSNFVFKAWMFLDFTYKILLNPAIKKKKYLNIAKGTIHQYLCGLAFFFLFCCFSLHHLSVRLNV